MVRTATAPTSGPLISLVASLLNDPRDKPFLWLMLQATFTVIPCAVALYIPGVFRWWLGALYLVMLPVLFLDRFILMLHNTSHRPLFKGRFRFMNGYIPWVLGPFFGESPDTYFAHHVGMHHLEANLHGDLSSTMPFRRDSALDFARYFFAFFGRGLADLAKYLTRKKRLKLRKRLISGEAAFLATIAVLALVNWRATLTVFVIPTVVVRFLMMAGNWGQHAFIDQKTPDSSYRNSITCLHDRYNRRCFNDGYHIGHHLKSGRHWTEMPEDFKQNRAVYARERAIVFAGVDYFGVWFLLMFKRYGTLASHYVTLEGPPRKRPEIIALLRERVQPIPATAAPGA